jgi:hypothetical protein
VGGAPRYVHRDAAKGYTSNPTHATRAEPEALTVDRLAELAVRARIRDRQARADDWAHQRVVIYSSLAEVRTQYKRRDVRRQVRASSSTASRGSTSCSGSDPLRESGRRSHP